MHSPLLQSAMTTTFARLRLCCWSCKGHQRLKFKVHRSFHISATNLSHVFQCGMSSSTVHFCNNIELMDNSEIQKFIASFDTVLSDCDGVLWAGGQAIEGSREAIKAFRNLGKQVIFVTNNGMSREDLLHRCHHLGYEGTLQDMVTSSYLSASYLKDIGFNKKVYVFGAEGLAHELDAVGIEHIGVGHDPMPVLWDKSVAEKVMSTDMDRNVGCVIVGFHYDLTFMKLLKGILFSNYIINMQYG